MRRIDTSPGVTNVQVTQSGTTDAAGRFALAGIAPGRYRLSAERSGFLTTQYGSRGPTKAGTLLTLEPGQKSSDMAMRLTPHGVIAGRVLDEEGEPVPNANVQVCGSSICGAEKNWCGQVEEPPTTSVNTASSACSRVACRERRQPAESSVAADRGRYITTFFPRATDAAAATPVDLARAHNRAISISRSPGAHGDRDGPGGYRDRPPGAGENPQRTNLNVLLSARNTMIVGTGFTRGAPVNPRGSSSSAAWRRDRTS